MGVFRVGRKNVVKVSHRFLRYPKKNTERTEKWKADLLDNSQINVNVLFESYLLGLLAMIYDGLPLTIALELRKKSEPFF